MKMIMINVKLAKFRRIESAMLTFDENEFGSSRFPESAPPIKRCFFRQTGVGPKINRTGLGLFASL